MSDKPTQQQFDWSKDSAECVEGLKFDLDTVYNFTLDDFTKHNLVRKDGTLVVYSEKAQKAGEPVLMYTFLFKEETTKVGFKLDFFVQERYRVNENAPETEDDIVKLSRKLGYSPVIGGRFALSDFVHLGTKIEAKLKEQPQSEADKAAGKKAYNTIDIDTVVAGEGGAGSQAEFPEDEVSLESLKEIQGMINASPKCKKFTDLTAKINKLGIKDKSKLELYQPAMLANQKGLLKFA